MFKFFIDRPILSASLSTIIVVLGLLSLKSLPLANYPQVAPPSVSLTAFYPGADASTVSESVAAVLEREINGAEGMIYISSKCFNNGKLAMTITFDVDRDADLALVDVQNRVATAEAQLPQEVIRQGVTVKKQSPDMLMVISLYSPNGTVSDLDLANYAARTIQDELGRIPGVGDVGLAGAGDYGMRLWLNPEQMEFYDITVSDVRNAVTDQNRLAPGGSFGQAPMAANVQLERTAQIKGRLTTPEEFKQIILRTNDDGSTVHLGSITPDMVTQETGPDGEAITKPGIELGAANYSSFSRFNGKPSTALIIYQLPSGNAVEISKDAKVRLNELRESLQRSGTDIDYVIALDMADFVQASLEELLYTFAEAILLVLVVVYLFLGSLRSTIVPLLAVPVSLIGVFAFFPMLGLSINNLTLFALVLAVGIVVDDAIVVVEAVEVHLEKGKAPHEAAILAMNDVGFTIIGITCALVAVFMPLTMLGGLTGRLYEQFALTLSISIAISALTSLTLSPALCALVLKQKNENDKPFVLVRIFNKFYGMLFKGYSAWVGTMVRRSGLTIILFACVYLGMGGAMHILPTSLVPQEDQRVFFMTLQMPNGTSQYRTLEVSNALVKELLESIPEITSVATLGGTQLATGAQSSSVASLIVLLTNWDERTKPGQDAMSLIKKAQQLATDKFQGPLVMAFNVPTISGLGVGAGLTLEVENTGTDTSPVAMLEPVGKLYQVFQQVPEIAAPFTAYSMQGRVTRLEVDREKAKSQGVSLNDVFDTVNTFLGGSYINDFQEFGRTYQVMMQAQSEFRAEETSLELFYLRNKYGGLTPTSSIITAVDTNGPEFLTRYNLYPNVEFMASPAPGYSSGEAMDAMMAKAQEALPTGFGFEWTGQSYQEQLAAGQTQVVIILAFICCFLVLAGLYESLISPLVVMFSVPIAILGALLGQLARGLTMDVFMQVGLVMLIGLAAKNAILIVQFAQERQKEGHPLAEAAVMAGKERLRPILMTSFAFILGVLPLVFATGAGANARHSLGTPVFAGMIVATSVGVFAIPGLYVLAQRWFGKKSKDSDTTNQPKSQPENKLANQPE